MKQLKIILLILTTWTCSAQTDNTESIKYNSYTNKKYGFTIDYPSTWDTTNRDKRLAFMGYEFSKDPNDKFNEGFNISVVSNQGLSLEQNVERNVQALKQAYGEDFEIGIEKLKNKNGVNYITLTMMQEAQGLVLISQTTFFDNGTESYALTQTTEQDKMKEYSDIRKTIIDSFNWVKKK